VTNLTRMYLEQCVTFHELDRWILPRWLLDNARSFGDYAPRPRYVRQGQPRYCFYNSIALALRRPDRFVYCEGMATNIIPTRHGWCYDRETGLVVDVTWEQGFDYIGVPFREDYLRRFRMTYEDGDTPLMDMSHEFPIITGVCPKSEWMEEVARCA
jgi:hypothetical protein